MLASSSIDLLERKEDILGFVLANKFDGRGMQ
jgi:hypothetical protein